MIQYRRLAALVLGAWLGAGIMVDLAVTENFRAVDRFLEKPGSVIAADELHKIGRDRERVLLRRNAGEENNFIFENWERVEIFTGFAMFLLLLFGSRPNKPMLAAVLLMTAIVCAQRFYFSPQVADLGRRIADLPAGDALNTKFWTMHGVYSGSEIAKLLVGVAFALRLATRRKADPDHFAKEYETETAGRARVAKRA